MSKHEPDIVHSPKAKTFLRMVTKGFYNNSYIGLWIYEVIGREWDEMREWAEGLKNEINPQTCTWSIGIWEWIYGFDLDESVPLEYRRQRIIAKIIGSRPISPEIIRRGVAALIGGKDEVEVNDYEPYRFSVTVRPDRNISLNHAKIYGYLNEIKPAHLAFDTDFEINPKNELVQFFGFKLCGIVKHIGASVKYEDDSLFEIKNEVNSGFRFGGIHKIINVEVKC